MSSVADVGLAFLRREIQVATSYRVQFLMEFAQGLFLVFGFYFISKLVDTGSDSLERYGGDYFSFVLIGVSATAFLVVGVSGFALRLRASMAEGSLEMMFASPVLPIWIIVMPCMWSFLFAGIRAVMMVAVGALFLGADFSQANLPVGLVVLLLSISAYSAIGILSTAIILVIKRGDPINWAFGQASALLAGAVFPIELLPSWLKFVSYCLPMSYSYDGLRLSLLQGAGFAEVWPNIGMLAVFSLVGIPIAVVLCNRAIAHVKLVGSLGSF